MSNGEIIIAKKAAAKAAVRDYIKDNMIIGIGSGSSILYIVEEIASLYKEGKLTKIKCIPTSFQSSELIISYDLPLGNLEQDIYIDVDLDGADECDEYLNCIKGGGGCHLHEKMVAFNSKKFIIVAHWTKQSTVLGEKFKQGVAVSFMPQSRRYLQACIKNKLNGECKLRMAKAKAGPVVTDEGHMIFDIVFPNMEHDKIGDIDHELHMMPGVIETGLFIGMAHEAYFGQKDGKVLKVLPKVDNNQKDKDNDGDINVESKTDN